MAIFARDALLFPLGIRWDWPLHFVVPALVVGGLVAWSARRWRVEGAGPC